MRSFRDIKRRARRDVHREMQVPALYIPNPKDLTSFQRVTVRVHTKFMALGDQKGTNFNSAEREDSTPRIVLWREEIPSPVRNAIISVEQGEAYRIDRTDPPDNLTITAYVTPVMAEDTDLLPVLGG